MKPSKEPDNYKTQPADVKVVLTGTPTHLEALAAALGELAADMWLNGKFDVD